MATLEQFKRTQRRRAASSAAVLRNAMTAAWDYSAQYADQPDLRFRSAWAFLTGTLEGREDTAGLPKRPIPGADAAEGSR